MKRRLPQKLTRRSFLSTSSKLALGVAGILAGNTGLFYYGSVHQENRKRTDQELPGNIVKLGELDRLNSTQGFEKVSYKATIRDSWVTTSSQGFVYVTKDPNGELLILSPICTHLGCQVEPATELQRKEKKDLFFLCPCHGAQFDIAGNAVGVVLRGLDTYKPILAGGSIYVDISSPIKR